MSSSMDATLTEIVEAIQALPIAQRRQLQKRLQVAGLLTPELLLSDQNRLTHAPALGQRRARAQRQTVAPVAQPTDAVVAERPVMEPPAAYRSPVSGQVVLGDPSSRATSDPHAMLPLPGQAPEQPISIIFDGGSKGNPGRGYGSYAVRWPGLPEQIVQLQFGDQVTNNEAEYDTLIAAVSAILKRLNDQGAAPATAHVEMRGDSALVVNQVNGEWKCNEARLISRRDRLQELLGQFGQWQLIHHDRANSVRVLGH